MKLKRGDFVRIRANPGLAAEIEVVDFSRFLVKYDRYFLKQPFGRWYNAEDVVSEELYNSPLYSELR